MTKRFIIVFLAVCLLFSINVSAKETVTLKPQGDFYVYGENTSQVAKIFDMTEQQIEDYCNTNGIVYLAVNNDNTKQIRITKSFTDFSNSVVNITGLSDDKINSLIPDIAGIEGARGEIVNLNGQKTVKIQLRTNDSGGEYILTEYVTVADRQCYVLSFYTDAECDTEYIEETFKTFRCSDFINNNTEKSGNWHYIVLIAAVIFAFVTVGVLIWIIRDIKKDKTLTQNEIQETE